MYYVGKANWSKLLLPQDFYALLYTKLDKAYLVNKSEAMQVIT